MDSPRDKEDFNMAVSELARINYSCALIEECMRTLDLYGWFMELHALSAILEKNMNRNQKELESIEDRLNILWPKIPNTIKPDRRGMIKADPSLFMELKHVYIDLRKVAAESQMLGRTEDEEDD